MAVAELDEPVTEVIVPKGYELLDGELTEMPAMGFEATQAAGEVYSHLLDWNRKARHGVLVYGDGCYACFPDRPRHYRKPDVSFIVCDPDAFVAPKGYYPDSPDLIVEVLSPTNTMGDIAERIDDFFAAGTRLAWIIDPELRYAMIQRPDDSIQKIRETGSLTGEDVLPGFTLPLAAILPKKQ
jgi:Uma2 family endonuclease